MVRYRCGRTGKQGYTVYFDADHGTLALTAEHVRHSILEITRAKRRDHRAYTLTAAGSSPVA